MSKKTVGMSTRYKVGGREPGIPNDLQPLSKLQFTEKQKHLHSKGARPIWGQQPHKRDRIA